MKKVFNFKDYTSGQTLIETVIAIFVILVGVAGALILVFSSTRAGVTAKNRIVAANLAREGIEVVRNIRDTNWLEGRDFNEGLANGSYTANYDSTSLTSSPISCDINDSSSVVNDLVKLYKDGSNLYSHNSTGTSTNFYRVINIEEKSDHELQITSCVAWIERGNYFLVNAEDHLFDWR